MIYVNRKSIYKILMLITIFATTLFLFIGVLRQTNDKIEKTSTQLGILDLYNWNTMQNEIINLDGQWEFYWQKLLTYDDIQHSNIKPDLLVSIPKVWNNYKINDNNLTGFGAATYRLRLKNVEMGQAIAIRMPTVSTAYNLYINNKLMASNGKVGLEKRYSTPEYQPVIFEFIPDSKEFDIIIQVSNFSYARGGIWNPIFMGTSENMKIYDKLIGYKDMFLVGAFLIMAIYYICIFFMRKDGIGYLYFTVLCLIAVTLTIIYGDYVINIIFPWIGYEAIVAIDYIATTWAPIVLVLLMGVLFPKHTSTKFKKIFTAYGVIYLFFIIIFPIHIYTSLLYPIQVVGLAMVAYAFFCVVKAFTQNQGDSTLVMIGAAFVTAGGFHDVLYHDNIIFSYLGELSPVAFLVFLFLNAIILARRFSQALKDANQVTEKLMKLDKMKDEFFVNTSHELRTPLNAMINIAETMKRGTEGKVNNDSQNISLDMIISNGKRLTNLINDVLDYSKLKNLDLKIRPETVNLRRIVESVLNVLGRLNKMAVIQMLVDIPHDLPDIYVDENRLLQILYNLVGNSVKFTNNGYIKVSAVKIGEMIEVCVEDTGIGIDEDKLDTIFESYQMLEDSLTRKNKGTGLGLSITKYLVEVHGGEMRVESKVGEGSKFYFTVPISTKAAEKRIHMFETADGEIAVARYDEVSCNKFPIKHMGNGPHIMLVDDNEANLMSLTGILKMENYSITAVTSSDDFLKEFKKEKELSLVILDVMLPGLSGYEICREIRKNYAVSELPVLMLTARTRTEDIVMGMEAGANDYLTKPFDTEELLARVNTLIRLKESVDKSITSELAFLQAQIKPHFLYNALNTFVSISRYDVEQARKLLVDFSNYLRRSFDFKGLSQVIPLSNEIELVKAYLAIEKAQYEERLEVNIEVCDEQEVKVPILILQPVVENAIIHGILPKKEGGRIEILIKIHGDILGFTVKDNGIGMEREKLRSVLEHESQGCVGLSNINSRLKKLYGKGIQIDSTPGIGTEVKWFVPMYCRESE